MTLSNALSNAYTGLSANARRTDVLANNIANANTEGYARRSVSLAPIVVDGRGAGVQVTSVEAERAPQLTQSRRGADADLAYQEQRVDVLSDFSRMMGDSEDPNALFSRYEELETSLRRLADDPEAIHSMTDVLRKAEDVAEGFNTINSEISDLRTFLDTEIKNQVDTLNDSLNSIVELNSDIVSDIARGNNAVEYISQRDEVLDRISTIVGIDVRQRDDGGVDVFTTEGYPLVAPSATEFEYNSVGVVTSNMDLVGGAAGGLSTLEAWNADVTPTTSNSPIMTSGSLAALFEARDVDTVRFQRQVDALAFDLINRFSAAAVEPDITVGDPGLFTDGQTLGTGSLGLAGRIEVNNLINPDEGGDLTDLRDGIGGAAREVGDNSHVTDLLGAMTSTRTAPANTLLSGDRTASDLLARMSSLIATDETSANATLTLRNSRQQTLEGEELTAIGVDIDQELQNLTIVEQAYAANARVLQVVDDLFQRLMEI